MGVRDLIGANLPPDASVISFRNSAHVVEEIERYVRGRTGASEPVDCRARLRLDFVLRHHPMLRSMPNTPKVVPLDQHRFRVIAADEKTNRIIIAIGRQRVALDMSTRITELPPDVGDKPAKMLPLITPRKLGKRKS